MIVHLLYQQLSHTHTHTLALLYHFINVVAPNRVGEKRAFSFSTDAIRIFRHHTTHMLAFSGDKRDLRKQKKH